MPETAPSSQTLSRGIRILELLAQERAPLTIDELAARLEVHRSIAYRLLRTLEDHGVVSRDSAGRVALGAGLAALAAGVAQDLQAAAVPELTAAADDLGMTCFLAIGDRGECVTLVSVEPRHAVASVAQRPGSRHPLTVGAPSKAILSMLPETEWPVPMPAELRAAVVDCLDRGYATSHDEVIPTVRAVAVPLAIHHGRPTAVAALQVSSSHPDDDVAARLRAAVAAVRAHLGHRS